MKDKGNRHGAVGKSSSEVATNLRTGLVHIAVKTRIWGPDWTSGPGNGTWPWAITNDLPTNLWSVPTRAWETLKNDTWGRILVYACRTDY